MPSKIPHRKHIKTKIKTENQLLKHLVTEKDWN